MTDLRDALVALEKELRAKSQRAENMSATDAEWQEAMAHGETAVKLAALIASHPSPDVEAMVAVAAKAMADVAGHGMAEKCEPQALAVLHAIGLSGMVADAGRLDWVIPRSATITRTQCGRSRVSICSRPPSHETERATPREAIDAAIALEASRG